jgi:hypothetical protein
MILLISDDSKKLHHAPILLLRWSQFFLTVELTSESATGRSSQNKSRLGLDDPLNSSSNSFTLSALGKF